MMHDFNKWPPQALTALRRRLAEELPPGLWDKIRAAVIDYEQLMTAAWQFEHGLNPPLLVAAGFGGYGGDDDPDDQDDFSPPWPSSPHDRFGQAAHQQLPFAVKGGYG